MSNIFEIATRKKIRFPTNRGAMSVEQLWEMPLRSRDEFNLDVTAKTIARELKNVSEESFVDTNQNGNTILETSLAIVKHVIGVKLAEEAAVQKRVENKREKERLLRILDEKQEGALSSLSEDELRKRLAALD